MKDMVTKMDYIYKKWFKTNNKYEIDRFYQKRFQGESTIQTGLKIKPKNFPTPFELYYIPTNAILLKIETIYHNDTKLRAYDSFLPSIAKENFLVDLMAEELDSSNKIEGVKSNKQEIAESTKKILTKTASPKMRLSSMIQSYLKLQDDTLNLPHQPEDIRKIYDDITEGEISDDNLPDGDLFRKDGVDIYNEASKTIHEGISGEREIYHHLEALLALLNQSQLPLLIRFAIGHYYFGYIHPFYDGNGRTGRFLTSLYLSKSFSIYTAYALSNGCHLAHKSYMEFFHRTNGFNNYGELNFALETFLDILIAGQTSILEDLEEKTSALRQTEERIDAIFPHDNLAQTILFLFCQQHLFDNGRFERNDIIHILKESFNDKHSKNKISTILTELENKDYLTKVKQKPITYVFNEARFYSPH